LTLDLGSLSKLVRELVVSVALRSHIDKNELVLRSATNFSHPAVVPLREAPHIQSKTLVFGVGAL